MSDYKFNADETIEKIKAATTVEAVNELSDGDDRKTVIEAATHRLDELKAEQPKDDPKAKGNPKAAKKPTKTKKVKVEITKPVAGRYLLPYNVGQKVSLEAKQAEELCEEGYAQKV